MEVSCEEPINLIRMNDTAYVWLSKDWYRIRRLRIVGNLIGNLATLRGQDRIAGLPMALLKEETTLLLEKGFATLITFKNFLAPPESDVQEKSKVKRDELLKAQVEILKNKRKAEIASKIDVIMKGKIEKKKYSENVEKSLTKIHEKDVLQMELSKIKDINKSNLAVQICTRDQWIKEENIIKCSWNYPETQESHKYMVFRDLWEKGYYITLGGKFGGDYLVYPGDPLKFHAFFIVICTHKNKKLNMHDIITYGRLGQSVKKTIVISYFDSENKVNYKSIKWAGF